MATDFQRLATIAELPPQNDMARRGFLVSTFGGLSLGFFLPGFSRLADAAAPRVSTQINAWIQIATDESVTITVGCAEMGQGSLSGLPQVVAEELTIDFNRVRVVQAAAAQAYVTGGSSSIRSHYLPLRQAGAAARELLILAAINRFGGMRDQYVVNAGIVTNTTTGKSLTYGQLASDAGRLTAPPTTSTWPPLKADSKFTLIGQAIPRLDIPSKTDGSAVYGLDVRVPGMLYAVVKHCPSFGGTLASFPAMPPGSIAVVPLTVIAATARGSELPGNVNAVAVVGSNTWDTWQSANQMTVAWKVPISSAALDTAVISAQAQQLLLNGKPYQAEAIGDADSAIAAATKKIDVTYSLPYVAHACMEVLNCTVSLTPTSCEVWAPTQAAGVVAQTVSALTILPIQNITVHTTLLGGGLGRKFEQDFIAQAVQVAKAVGKPVKLMWPREEDFTHDQYRPTALIRVKAGIDSSNKVVGWSYRNVSPSILLQRGWPIGSTGDGQATEGSTALPYQFSSRLVEWVQHPAAIPVGFWRSVGNSLNAFAVESAIDELAVAAKVDPYLFRRDLLAHDPRTLAVLDAAANLAGWHMNLPTGHARGIALCASFDSIVAQVFEISAPNTSSLSVVKVACVIDCGRPVNPNSIEAQMQGGIVHGINATLWGQITFKNGAASAHNFNQNRVLRPQEMPQISVTIMPANPAVAVGGVGEPAVPPVAPAIANAYFALTGKRIRSLPFFPGSRMGGL